MPIGENIRQELIRLASSSRTRTSKFTREAPCDWRPQNVLDPSTGEPFTDVGAWHFIVDCLTHLTCEEIDMIVLDRPPGKSGYVLIRPGAHGRPSIYIKLDIISGAVRGRSFHDCAL